MTRSTDLEDVRLLEEEFAEAMTRLYAVGNGLAALRMKLIAEPDVPPLAAVAVAEVGFATGPTVPGPTLAPPPLVAAPARPARPMPALAPPWWQREGMVVRLLGLAGAGVLLIGVALLLAFAIQHGYLGPTARVAGVGLLAASLVVLAVRLHRDPARRAGAVAIAAAGYAAADLDIVAVTAIYRWLPPATGLVLAGLICASGVILARAWGRQLLALITIGGAAALAPWVGDGQAVLIAAFLVVLAAAAFPAHIGRDWLVLHAVRSVPAAAAVVLAAIVEPGRPVFVLASALAAVELGTALLGTRVPARTGLLTPVLLATSLPVLVAAPGAGLWVWAVAAVLAAVHLLVALGVGPVPPAVPALALQPWAGALSATYAVFAVLDGVPRPNAPAALLGLACGWLALARAVDGQRPDGRQHRTAWATWCAVALAAAAVVDYLSLATRLLDRQAAIAGVTASDVLAALLLVAVAALLPGVLGAAVPVSTPGGLPLALPLACPLGLLGVSAAVVSAAVLAGARLGAPAGGFVAGHGLATLLWAAAAAYLLMHGLRRSRDATLSLRIGLVLAAVAVAKLLLFDLATLDGIVRVAAFIGAGLALLAMGAGYARALDRTRLTPGPSRG